MAVCINLEWDEAEPLGEACVTSIAAAFRSDPFRVPREWSKSKAGAPPASDAAQSNDLDRATALALVDAGYMALRRYHELFGEELSVPSTRLKAS
jgi:hypothetical protein